jgi:predicted helicase
LGIVFTPVPVVDYILRSADAALRLEFGKSLSDEGVSILEPFVGTGTFVTRLLQSGLIKPEDLHRKYTTELFANEIVLLSYYIAAINIETVYAEVAAAAGAEAGYIPFDGIALTDTFQLNESDNQLESSEFFPENNERVKRQKNAPIQVIVMNPPYSTGQTSANDDNQNQAYPVLDASIAESYAKQSTATNKNSLYDSYIRGIRWASNRITNDGVIAFVSNGSFLDANSMDGIRKTFATEFSRVFVYNLRGNQRTSGEQSRKEGGKVFGSGSRTQVAICVLIKNSAQTGPTDIRYRDIGDYLTREQKLDILSIEQSLEGTDWETITPNDHGDWINHRDERYDTFQPIGDKTTKGKPGTPGIFANFSSGLKTNRDAWCYNFSRNAVESHMRRMLDTYNSEVARYKGSGMNLDDAGALGFVDKEPLAISWDRSLRTELRRKRSLEFRQTALRTSAYRPFTRQVIYFAKELNNDQSQLPKLFPTPAHPNLAIGASGEKRRDWSCLVADTLPDLEHVSKAQWFSLYTYEPVPEDELAIPAESEVIIDGYRRKDNITDATLSTYCGFYEDTTISKEDIFYYVYGLLHSPTYKETYKADLMKMLPRIPKVRNFWGFSTAGRALADLHLNYEAVPPAELTEARRTEPPTDVEAQYDYYRVQKLSWGARKDHSRIVYNSNITLGGIPEGVLDYQVNGKSAIEWILDRYQVTTHKDSQITNDPNDYCREVEDPRYIIDLIKRIVTVSVETNMIVAGLPVLEIAE